MLVVVIIAEASGVVAGKVEFGDAQVVDVDFRIVSLDICRVEDVELSHMDETLNPKP